MIRTPQVPTLSDPKLIDYVLIELQQALVAGLSWLDHAFGKAQIMKTLKDGREVIYPGVYVGVKDYIKVFPDDHIGNFAFFVVDDGEAVAYIRPATDIEANFGLVIWFDLRSVYPSPADWQTKTVDNVKEDVLRVLAGAFIRSQFRVDRVFERPSNVFREFTDKEIETQYSARPYGMIRIDGVIKFKQKTRC